LWWAASIRRSASVGIDLACSPITLALMGGTGTILAPILGGAIYIYLQFYAISFLATFLPGMVYFPNATIGLILIIVGLFAPRGIVGSLRVQRLFRRLYVEMTK